MVELVPYTARDGSVTHFGAISEYLYNYWLMGSWILKPITHTVSCYVTHQTRNMCVIDYISWTAVTKTGYKIFLCKFCLASKSLVHIKKTTLYIFTYLLTEIKQIMQDTNLSNYKHRRRALHTLVFNCFCY